MCSSDLQAAIARADAALYEAKARGRDRVSLAAAIDVARHHIHVAAAAVPTIAVGSCDFCAARIAIVVAGMSWMLLVLIAVWGRDLRGGIARVQRHLAGQLVVGATLAGPGVAADHRLYRARHGAAGLRAGGGDGCAIAEDPRGGRGEVGAARPHPTLADVRPTFSRVREKAAPASAGIG